MFYAEHNLSTQLPRCHHPQFYIRLVSCYYFFQENITLTPFAVKRIAELPIRGRWPLPVHCVEVRSLNNKVRDME